MQLDPLSLKLVNVFVGKLGVIYWMCSCETLSSHKIDVLLLLLLKKMK